jgi:predicted membrane protein
MVLLYLGLRNPAFRQVSGVALMVLSAFLLLGGWYYAWTNRSVIQIFSAMMFPVGSVLWYLKVLDAQSAAIWFAACFVMLLLVVIYISSGSAARKIPPQANFNA